MRLDPKSVYAGYLVGQIAGYGLAMARARADLQMLAANLADEIAACRRELAEEKAELARLKAIDSAV
jgi:hypothetical protein